MADPTNYCLGLQFLGECAYKPGSPYSVYFSLGEAVSALAFTVAVQQLLRPILQLRLEAHRLSVSMLYGAVFVGAGVVLVASLVPHIPLLHYGPWGFAIVWELLAALIFIGAYGTIAWVVSRPATVGRYNMIQFCGASARLMSAATEADHVDYVRDLLRALPRLMKASQILQRPSEYATAFWVFIHRDEITRGSHAWGLLQLLADPQFCRTLVRRTPWAVVEMLRELDEQRLHATAAQQFVREIAYQAVFDDESIMVRETGYTGFGTAPFLTRSIFGSLHIVSSFDPYDWLFSRERSVTQSVVRRFNAAFKATMHTVVEEQAFHHIQALFSARQFYETLGRECEALQRQDARDYELAMAISRCFESSIEWGRHFERAADPAFYPHLFARGRSVDFFQDTLGALAEIAYEGIAGISNNFKGHGDIFWMMAIELLRKAFPMFSDEADGMTPYQQRLAMMLISRVRDNMNGRYPAVTRVLLAVVGPYHRA
ncbi:MAG TPA: hypothetical protein VKY24_03440, partial [Reyranella sp.]|nr:hypothetical protein [Reyranella sp.]